MIDPKAIEFAREFRALVERTGYTIFGGYDGDVRMRHVARPYEDQTVPYDLDDLALHIAYMFAPRGLDVGPLYQLRDEVQALLDHGTRIPNQDRGADAEGTD